MCLDLPAQHLLGIYHITSPCLCTLSLTFNLQSIIIIASQVIASELAHALRDDIKRITCSAIHDTRSAVNNRINLEGYVYKRGGVNTDFKRRQAMRCSAL